MSFLAIYAIFALATGIVVCIDHLATVISLREKSHKVENKFLLYVVVMGISLLLAPLLFLSCIIPSMSANAKMGLYNGLFES